MNPLRQTIGRGALAGGVAGLLAAVTQGWLVEPLIRTSIALEEAGEVHQDTGAHSHGSTGGHVHTAEVVIARPEQVAFGMITVLVVGVLLGIAFALVHRVVRHWIPGGGPAGTTMALAVLGFAAFSLFPAVVIPANPPGVGDPATVTLRTTTYLATIGCAVALAVLVLAVARQHQLGVVRVPACAALAVVGVAVVLWALPDTAAPTPDGVPADLL